MKCHFCKKEATKRYSPDLDIEGIPICDDTECFMKLYILIHGDKFIK